MLIKCPFCQTEARLPESKEGAKVRCGECEKVYTARPKGVRGRQQDSNTTMRLAIGAGALVVLGIVFVLVQRSGADGPRPVAAATVPEPAAAPREEAPRAPASPWESEPVLAVRDLYEAVSAYDDARALSWLDLPALHAARRSEGAAEFSTLSASELASFREELLDEITDRERPDALGSWKPFDADLIREGADESLVEIKVTGLDSETSLETRTLAWTLTRATSGEGPWQISSWERVLTPAEARALRKAQQARVQHVQLSDGSKVFESLPEALDHLDSTPLELRERIDELYVQLIDLTLPPKHNANAKAELVEIGGPALPILLTGLFEIPIETQDEAIQVNLINQCLEEITGEYTGYKPQLFEGSATGTTAERRDSAIKQWFAWWNRKGTEFLAGESVSTPED